MRVKIWMGESSSGIQDEKGNILGSVDWLSDEKTFLVSAGKLPKLDGLKVRDTAELKQKIREILDDDPEIILMTAPLIMKH